MTQSLWRIEVEKFQGDPYRFLEEAKEERIDLCNFSLTQIINQYIHWLSNFEGSIDIAADFLLLSCSLIFLKSSLLLPSSKLEKEEGEEKEWKEAFEGNTELYQEFKQLAQELKTKERERTLLFTRPRFKENGVYPAEERKEKKGNIETLIHLFTQLSSSLFSSPVKIVRERWSVKEKIKQILEWLGRESCICLKKLFSSAEHKLEIIAFFLATLELIRANKISVRQEELFGEVYLIRKQPEELMEWDGEGGDKEDN